MGISVLTLGKFQKNQDKLVTLNLGHVGFEESVDSGQQVVEDGGMVCQKDVRIRGVAWRVADVEPLVSLIFLKRSLVFPILSFSYISLH